MQYRQTQVERIYKEKKETMKNGGIVIKSQRLIKVARKEAIITKEEKMNFSVVARGIK